MNSIPEAVKANSMPLSIIRQKIGEVGTKALLVELLTNLIRFFNIGKSMNDSQVADTINLILKEYYFLKIEDFKLCFDGIKTGKYLKGGQLYDRLDGQIILCAIGTYCAERIEVAEQLSLENHKEITSPEQRYYVSVEKNFIRETAPGSYEEVVERELATAFKWQEALDIKQWLGKQGINGVKISYTNKSEIGLIEYIKQHKPHLLGEKFNNREKYLERVKDYKEFEKRVEADNTLGDLQKHNALREYLGMNPVTEAEYLNYIRETTKGYIYAEQERERQMRDYSKGCISKE
ncbi:MAG TPA: hypothetical protein VG603_01430 [Chitinophagales bacterium]|nr:hypothetical protein [Chitinophagales bacterium]